MYAREFEGRTLTFGVSGALLRDSMVMYDRQTGSYWTQVDGLAIGGALKGRALQAVPSVHTTWEGVEGPLSTESGTAEAPWARLVI